MITSTLTIEPDVPEPQEAQEVSGGQVEPEQAEGDAQYAAGPQAQPVLPGAGHPDAEQPAAAGGVGGL